MKEDDDKSTRRYEESTEALNGMIEKDSYSGRLGILVGSSNRLDRINMLEMERIKDRRRHRRICLFPPLLLAPTSGMKWISCMSNSCKERLVGQNGCASHNDCVPSSGKASQARSRSIIVVFSHQIEVNARLTARRKGYVFQEGPASRLDPSNPPRWSKSKEMA